MASTRINLAARLPFNLVSVVQSHGWVALAPFESDENRREFTYVDQLDSGQTVEYRVRGDNMGARARVIARSRLSTKQREEVTRRLRWMLDLDSELEEFYELAKLEPKLAGVRDEARGRFLRSPTIWEDVVKTILTTNVTWAGTVSMVRSLVETYGRPLDQDHDTTSGTREKEVPRGSSSPRRAFPTPERIAALTGDVLKANCGLGYRSASIHELAVRQTTGDIGLESLKDSASTTADLQERLRSIRGVGPYAAATVLTLLGRFDFIPVDSWALTLVSHEWHGGTRITPSQVEPHFDGWGKWKALAYWLWDWDYKKRGDD